jgi:hypothetical protein
LRLEQSFTVACPAEAVFAFMVDVENLAKWQTVKTYATPLTEGPPRLGYRVKEGTKVGPREWDQVVEFTQFEPGRVLGVKVIEGPPSTGSWRMRPEGAGTRVDFEAELEAPRLLAPLLRPVMTRQWRRFHDNLRREAEARCS